VSKMWSVVILGPKNIWSVVVCGIQADRCKILNYDVALQFTNSPIYIKSR